jgi:hypothetical protein
MGVWYLEVGATRCDVGMQNSQAVEERPPIRMNRTDERGNASGDRAGDHTVTTKFGNIVPYHTIVAKYGGMVSSGCEREHWGLLDFPGEVRRPQGCRHLRRGQCQAPLSRRCPRVALPATAASGTSSTHRFVCPPAHITGAANALRFALPQFSSVAQDVAAGGERSGRCSGVDGASAPRDMHGARGTL